MSLLKVEQRGIEFVPYSSRYGTPKRLFTVWFGVNLSILCLTVGTLGVFAGLPLAWTCLALTLGNAIGTFFMAAHAVQGPQLGIPQMIQSRAQFGVLGAGLPLIAVLASMTLYSSANAILIEGTIRMLLPVTTITAIVLFGAMTVLVAFVGYELIHRLAATLTVLSGAVFLIVPVLLGFHGARAITAASASHLTAATFILVVTQATAWSLSSAPTVADYSRYLPPTVSVTTTFWYTGLGNFLSCTLVMFVGAYLAASFPALASRPGAGIANLFGSGRYVVAFLITVNLLQVNVMNLYSAYMSGTTVITGIRGMQRVSLRYKLCVMIVVMSIATAIAVLARHRFTASFSDLLAILVYTLIPWSAINLVDYYLVRQGQYRIDQIFDMDGIYGRYRWRTIVVYLVSIIVQIPFMNVSFYEGTVAHLIGADIAWLPGTLVPAILYALVEHARKIPLTRTPEIDD